MHRHRGNTKLSLMSMMTHVFLVWELKTNAQRPGRVESLSTVLYRIDGLDDNEFNTQQQNEMNKAILGCHNVSMELEATLNKFGILKNNSTAHWKDTVRRAWKRTRWDQAEIDNFRSRVVSNISLFNNVVSNINQFVLLKLSFPFKLQKY